MRRRTTLGDRNLVGENIIRIRAEKKMSHGDLLSPIQLMGMLYRSSVALLAAQ